MKTRILVGIGLVFLLAAMFLLGPWFRAIAFTAAALISIYEMDQVFRAKGHRICTWPLYAIGALYGLAFLPTPGSPPWGCACCYAPWPCASSGCAIPGVPWRTPFVLCLFASIPGFLCYAGNGGEPFRLPAPLMLYRPLVGGYGGYFIGSALGKHKLCPHISPKRPWKAA